MAETTCQCAVFRNVRIPEHRNHPCDRVIEKKHILCRPCALAWHDGPCETYIREPVFHLVKTCARCGHDSALHAPRDEHEPPHEREELQVKPVSDRDKINAVFGLD